MDSIAPSGFKQRVVDILRYWELLSANEEKYNVSLGEGGTPLLKLSKAAKALGMKDLWLKDDGKNRENTFKCHSLPVAVSKVVPSLKVSASRKQNV